jgi:hypothetical protein
MIKKIIIKKIISFSSFDILNFVVTVDIVIGVVVACMK